MMNEKIDSMKGIMALILMVVLIFSKTVFWGFDNGRRLLVRNSNNSSCSVNNRTCFNRQIL